MSTLNKRLTAVVATLLLYSGLVAPNALALSYSANTALTGEALATVTALSGTVFKRDFIDWEKEVWGEPATATVNDKLHEGMQIGTGNNSWAEVAWPNVKTRAWANTVFAIAPNKRLVYLTGGEMLFRLDKHRKDKDKEYFIWTKVLQARIRGTSVLVQAKGLSTRFTVLEGTVDIFNRLDHSKVTLKPGVVYEILGYQVPKTGSQPKYTDDTQQKPIQGPPKLDNVVTDITYSKESKTPLFQDTYATTNIFPANSEALKTHPLVLTAGGPIDSLPLIQQEQADIPGFNPALPIRLADGARLNKVLTNGVELKAVPSNVDYFVGDIVGKLLKLPESAKLLPPKGVILSPRRTAMTPALPSVAKAPPPMPMIIPMLQPTAKSTDGLAADVATEASDTVFETEQQLPVAEFAHTLLVAPIANPAAAVTTQNPALQAFQPLPGTVSNIMSAPIGGAGISAITGSPATMSAPLAPMTGAISPMTNIVSPVTNGLPGTLNNSVSPLTNTLQNTLQGAGKPLGNTINNLTNGLTLH
jgi:hypothetical protein